MAPGGRCNSDRVVLPKVQRPPCFNPGARCWPCKSIELIGGDLLRGCECHKHNGLQDNCRRSECRGSCWCRSKPWASCRPSQFANEYSNPGIYLSAKHGPPPWSRCPGSSTNPCPYCGSLWLSPPIEMKNPTTGYCLDSNCNCCAKAPDSLHNKEMKPCEQGAKEEQHIVQNYGKRVNCSSCFSQSIPLSKSTQCNVENPVENPESDCRAHCQVFCTQPYYQSEVSLPYNENQSYAVTVSNMMNPSLHNVNTCCKFCPLHEHCVPCHCMGNNCPFYQGPSCPFFLNPYCGCYYFPSPNEAAQKLRNEKPIVCEKSVLCRPEEFVAFVGGRFLGRGLDRRNGLQDQLDS